MKALRYLMALSIFALPLALHAQDDDVYFVPKKAAKQKTESRYVPVEIVYDDNEMPETRGSSRNIDEYNRRYRSSGSMTYQLPGSDTVYVMDEASQQTQSAYNQGFSDGEDYAYSRRLSRFGYSSVYVSPWYWSYYHDPYYWNDWYWGAYDPYWYGWHGYGWGRPYWSAYWGYGWGGWHIGWHSSWRHPYHHGSWYPRSTTTFRGAGYLGRGMRGSGYVGNRRSGGSAGSNRQSYSSNTRGGGYTGNTRGGGYTGNTRTDRSTSIQRSTPSSSVSVPRSSGYSGGTRSGSFSGGSGLSGGSRSGGGFSGGSRGGGGRGR